MEWQNEFTRCLLFQNSTPFLRSHEIVLEAVATDDDLNQTIYDIRMWFHRIYHSFKADNQQSVVTH